MATPYMYMYMYIYTYNIYGVLFPQRKNNAQVQRGKNAQVQRKTTIRFNGKTTLRFNSIIEREREDLAWGRSAADSIMAEIVLKFRKYALGPELCARGKRRFVV